MALTNDFLDAACAAAARLPGPRTYPWPIEGNPAGFLTFKNFEDWCAFILCLSLRKTLPETIRTKFETAQKLYLLGWLDGGVLKAGEFAALSCLELALRDRYGGAIKDSKGNMYFDRLLRYMPEHDELTNDQLPSCRRSGGDIVSNLKSQKPTVAYLRNRHAHAEPFDTAPYSGTLEVARDLIEYAYRNWP